MRWLAKSGVNHKSYKQLGPAYHCFYWLTDHRRITNAAVDWFHEHQSQNNQTPLLLPCAGMSYK